MKSDRNEIRLLNCITNNDLFYHTCRKRSLEKLFKSRIHVISLTLYSREVNRINLFLIGILIR